MLFLSRGFKHKIKLKLVNLKIWWFLESIYRFFWKAWVNTDTDDFSTSPLVIAEMVKEIIKGKKVCELGCRKGLLLLELKKYAREVMGIELENSLCKICEKKGLNVICGDIFEIDIPDADVYYFWLSPKSAQKTMAKLREQKKKGIVIRGITPVVWEMEKMEYKQFLTEGLIINCPRRWSIEEDFKIQIIKL